MIGGPNLRYVRVDDYHDVHTGRGNVDVCLCPSLIYNNNGILVYVMVASSEIWGNLCYPERV